MLVDGLQVTVDVVEVELWTLPWDATVAVLPIAGLLGPGPRDRLGQDVTSLQVHETRLVELALENLEVGADRVAVGGAEPGDHLFHRPPHDPCCEDTIGLLPAETNHYQVDQD